MASDESSTTIGYNFQRLIGGLQTPYKDVGISLFAASTDERDMSEQTALATVRYDERAATPNEQLYAVDIPLETGGLKLRLRVVDQLQVGLQPTLIAIFLAGLFCLSVFFAMQFK